MSVIPQMPAPSSALDPKSREPAAAPAPACPGEVSWDYDRAEIIADGAVHATGIVLGLAGAVAIVIAAIKMDDVGIAPVVIYIIGLVTMLALSALYNMWPISPTKWVLRRFDHFAIYLLIAGTYTPFLAQLKLGIISMGLGIGVWASAVIGMVLKLALPGRFDRLAVVLFLLLGWSGAIVYESFASVLPTSSLWLLAIGGILYSVGVLFMAGAACAFTMRSGMASYCWRQVATIRPFSRSWRRHD